MPKTPIHYLEVDPWSIVEDGYHPDRGRVSESIFSLGNEFMGVRGYFEEGYSGDRQRGSYFNGIFEREKLDHPYPHRGLALDNHFIVNAVDWLYTRITLDGEQLDLAESEFRDFTRRLDLKNGLMTRRFVWVTDTGKEVEVKFQRFTSMVNENVGCQRLSFRALNFDGTLEVETGLDFSVDQYEKDEHYWTVAAKRSSGECPAIVAQTDKSKHKVFSCCRLNCTQNLNAQPVERAEYVGKEFELDLEQDTPVSVDKTVVNLTETGEDVSPDEFYSRSVAETKDTVQRGFDEEFDRHAAFWNDVWEKLDIEIEGDPFNQQGIRFGIFQLHQAYHGVDPTNNVAAKGLTGEAYGGRAWWDTETYCQSFYMFNNPRASRHLLEYRYHTLPEACERSKEVDDCVGARYPMATIDGTESIAVWQHGDLEIHVSAAVAYAIWHYENVVGDKDFLYGMGAEMLVEISRYYASRGQYSQLNGEFGYWNVMGPDEFHMQVHNNAYTNVMAKKTFQYTNAVIEEMGEEAPERLAELKEKTGMTADEREDWASKAEKMRTNYDEETEMYEQHDGFFDLPHLDCSHLDPDELPLYDHWAYLRLFRYDMIKQPDVLLLLFFFSHEYSQKCKKVNYEYYEPRCSHESSLSPAIHSIMASELGKRDEAYEYFQHATRLDLDDYNRNTELGLHTTSMAAAWMNIVQGFGGMRTDADCIDFSPSIPDKWDAYSFRILYRGSVLRVRVETDEAQFTVIDGDPVEIRIYGEKQTVGGDGVEVAL